MPALRSSRTVSKDLGFSELIALPLLIVLALMFFRGRAALMPLAVGIRTVLGTFLALRGINERRGQESRSLAVDRHQQPGGVEAVAHQVLNESPTRLGDSVRQVPVHATDFDQPRASGKSADGA